jgi:hypothetical protein
MKGKRALKTPGRLTRKWRDRLDKVGQPGGPVYALD